jgi:restriction system protein
VVLVVAAGLNLLAGRTVGRMGVPDYQSLMRPVLAALSDGVLRTSKQLRDDIASSLGLSVEDQAVLLPSGNQTLFANRVGWAVTYLAKAGAVDRPRRGQVQITDRGRHLLSAHPDRVDVGILGQFEEFEQFRTAHRAEPGAVVPEPAPVDEMTPTERVDALIAALDAQVAEELLGLVYQAGSVFLERLSLTLLAAMGYGGLEASEHTGRSGDAGLDGIIRQDALGLDLVGVQAKCYALDASVQRPEIQAFVGALQGAQTSRGVFVTTARFSKGARDYADSVAVRLVLIDGADLTRLMLAHKVGVTVRDTYEVKAIDRDFFEE